MWPTPCWMAPTASCFPARLLLETSRSKYVSSCWLKNPMACLQALYQFLYNFICFLHCWLVLLYRSRVLSVSHMHGTAVASITECGILHCLETAFVCCSCASITHTVWHTLQAVQVMTKICAESERSLDYYGLFKQIMKRAPVPMSPLESLASSAVRTAHKVSSPPKPLVLHTLKTCSKGCMFRSLCYYRCLTGHSPPPPRPLPLFCSLLR